MLVFQEFTTEPHECPYLAGRQATLEYQFVAELEPAEYEQLMNRGHRKFGIAVFRPVCEDCTACRPIRIAVGSFRPDRTQRRTWERNQDLRVEFAEPTVDRQRIELYDRYHRAQAAKKGWPEKVPDAAEYVMSFVQNPLPAVEITLWEGDLLRAVVLTEVTPNVVSGIYHYHDPELSRRSIGTYCMLRTIELAERLEKPWAYFGFYVAGCASMLYKAHFRPCELMDSDGVWRPFAEKEQQR